MIGRGLKGLRSAYGSVGSIGRSSTKQAAMRASNQTRVFKRNSSLNNLQRSGRRRMMTGAAGLGLAASPGTSSGARGRPMGRSSGSLGLR